MDWKEIGWSEPRTPLQEELDRYIFSHMVHEPSDERWLDVLSALEIMAKGEKNPRAHVVERIKDTLDLHNEPELTLALNAYCSSLIHEEGRQIRPTLANGNALGPRYVDHHIMDVCHLSHIVVDHLVRNGRWVALGSSYDNEKVFESSIQNYLLHRGFDEEYSLRHAIMITEMFSNSEQAGATSVFFRLEEDNDNFYYTVHNNRGGFDAKAAMQKYNFGFDEHIAAIKCLETEKFAHGVLAGDVCEERGYTRGWGFALIKGQSFDVKVGYNDQSTTFYLAIPKDAERLARIPDTAG